MKWLSGDFVSQYNKLMSQLKEEQSNLDEKFANDFNNLVDSRSLDSSRQFPLSMKSAKRWSIHSAKWEQWSAAI